MTADALNDAAHPAPHALPAGTRFGELEILGTLGVGGFGIVYLALDHSLEREVAVKEYMPSQFAQRDGHSHVSVRSASMRETFELGRLSFVNEAKLLARFDHPSLLKVYRFWESNGTAYMVMPRLLGHNLREARTAQTTPPPEAWARRIFDAVLSGLEALHAQQVWHRDVAPDNIWLPADGGPPILLDFGAARQTIGDSPQAFTAILKPRFAPIEQYGESAHLKQGPWTDFYALAAVMHELLTGRPPPPCTARAMLDELLPLTAEGYAPRFLAALDWALRLPPHQRPQSAAEWRDVIEGRAVVPARMATPPRAKPPAPPPPPAPSKLDLEFADTVQVMPSDMMPLGDPVTAAAPKGAAAAAASARRLSPRLLAVAGAAALLMLALFVGLLRDTLNKQTTPPAGLAASAVGAASAASAASVPQAALPPSEPVTAQLPVAVEPAPDAASASAPVAAAAVQPASAPARPQTVARRESARPIVTEKAGEFRPVQRSAAYTPPETSASVSMPAPAPRQTAPAPASSEHRTASEACSNRTLFARAWCIDRQCEKPQFRNDAECVRLREIREMRNSQRDGP